MAGHLWELSSQLTRWPLEEDRRKEEEAETRKEKEEERKEEVQQALLAKEADLNFYFYLFLFLSLSVALCILVWFDWLNLHLMDENLFESNLTHLTQPWGG